MRKQFDFLMMAMIALMPLFFTSCGDDDDDDDSLSQKNEVINVNGKDYETTFFMTQEGFFNPNNNEGEFSITYFTKEGSTKTVYFFTFSFNSESQPQIGDDFAQKDLRLSVAFSHFFDEFDVSQDEDPWDEIACTGGSAKIVGIDKSKEKMTIKFNNLKMGRGKHSYTFNGTVSVDYNFARTSSDD